MSKFLYIVVCAAPPAAEVHQLVELAQKEAWDVAVIATPQATNFIDRARLESLTGYPVRSTYKHPTEQDVLPKPDAIIVAPATFNTINKLALGIADTLALGVLCEAIGKRLPIVAVPCVKDDLAAHPAFSQSINTLQIYGATILYKSDQQASKIFSWQNILDACLSNYSG